MRIHPSLLRSWPCRARVLACRTQKGRLTNSKWRAIAASAPSTGQPTPAASCPPVTTPGWPSGQLLILAAGRDDYDLRRGAADCTAFLAAIPGGPPARARLHIYPNATHGWDVGVGQSAWDPAARNLRGGTVTFTPDPGVTEDSQARLLAFMRRHLMGQ